MGFGNVCTGGVAAPPTLCQSCPPLILIVLSAMAFRSIARRSGGGVAHRRAFLPSRRLHRRQEFLLADIGEGIAEVEVLKW
jgi:hypothetical protein